MKKLLLLLLCVPLMFSCGENKEEKSSSIVSCSITENIWINETNQISNLFRDFPSYATDSVHYGFYFALRFMENYNIEFYRCGESFINKNSDIINNLDTIGVWGNSQYISDTSCYRLLFGISKWEKIDDTTVIVVKNIGGKPNFTIDPDTIDIIDCNTLEFSNGIKLFNVFPGGHTFEMSTYYNRSPKLN